MKIILLTVAILLLVGSSKQQDDLLSQLKRPQLKQKTQDIVERKLLKNFIFETFI